MYGHKVFDFWNFSHNKVIGMELNHGTREAFLQSKLKNWQKVRGGGVGDEILHIKGVGGKCETIRH